MPWTLALALLIAGCGFEPAPTGPEDPGPTIAEPPFEEPEFAATATNLWMTKATMPTARYDLAAGVVNGVLYATGVLPRIPGSQPCRLIAPAVTLG